MSADLLGLLKNPPPEIVAWMSRRLLLRPACIAERGAPFIWLSPFGWGCRIDLTTSAAGAEFNIRSELNHATPIAAALECRDRMFAALGGPRAP